MSFYAYMWLRDDGTPYYIGKGSGRRAFIPWGHAVFPPIDKSRILVFDRDSEIEAFATEKELIRNWGRLDLGTGCLRNMTDGGDGVCGKSPEALARISVANLGNDHGRGNKSHLGQKHSDDTKIKMRVSHSGKSHPNLVSPFLGCHHTEESKAKLRAARIGKSWSAAMWAAQAKRYGWAEEVQHV